MINPTPPLLTIGKIGTWLGNWGFGGACSIHLFLLLVLLLPDAIGNSLAMLFLEGLIGHISPASGAGVS